MSKNALLLVWSWLIISVLLEVVIAYAFSGARWYIRDTLEGVVALTAAGSLALVYMGLMQEHLSVKMFVLVALFFSTDLLLIWTGTVVHG